MVNSRHEAKLIATNVSPTSIKCQCSFGGTEYRPTLAPSLRLAMQLTPRAIQRQAWRMQEGRPCAAQKIFAEIVGGELLTGPHQRAVKRYRLCPSCHQRLCLELQARPDVLVNLTAFFSAWRRRRPQLTEAQVAPSANVCGGGTGSPLK